MRRVRLMTWCPRSAGGLQLPAFAAAAGGLFAERGLEVEFVEAPRSADASVPGRLEAVAAGDADLALTYAAYMLVAQTEARGALPVRFVAVGHQRHPIVAVVRADSGLRTPEDLAGARTARWSAWFADEYAAALAFVGAGAAVMVDVVGGLDPALVSGDVDVLPVWMDEIVPLALQGMTIHHGGAAIEVRVIALDIPIYTTGLVAADRLAPDVIRSVRDAWVGGFELQREHPEPGLAAFAGQFPDVAEEHTRAQWALFDAGARSDGACPGSMDADRWQATVAHTARTHGLTSFPGDRIYRPELLGHVGPHDPHAARAGEDGRAGENIVPAHRDPAQVGRAVDAVEPAVAQLDGLKARPAEVGAAEVAAVDQHRA